MNHIDFGRTPRWLLAVRGGGLTASVIAHVLFARYALVERADPGKKNTWVEMSVVETPPPPPEAPPPPPPEPEPPKPKPKPEKVEFKDTVKEPPPEQPPPEKQIRRVQGLTASSFAQGSGTGFAARAGTTLATRATDETLTVEEAARSVSFIAATVQPKCRHPTLEVPQEVIDAEIEGTVDVLFDVTAQGAVVDVRVTRGLDPAADAACVRSWMQARCKPGRKGDTAVTVTNMPHGCRYKAIE